jgi:hypothetical protein
MRTLDVELGEELVIEDVTVVALDIEEDRVLVRIRDRDSTRLVQLRVPAPETALAGAEGRFV